jgi:hypothetical protein
MGDTVSTGGKAAVVLPPEDEAALVPLRYRHDGWTAGAQRRFLQALGDTGCVRDACRAVGRSNTSAYRLRARSPEFAAAWDRALNMAATVLEQTAFARAVTGVEEPVWHCGKQVGTRRRYSDSLLKLLIQRGDLRDGHTMSPEEKLAAAKDMARAAGGYFITRGKAEETDAALREKLRMLAVRIARERDASPPDGA